MARKVLAKPVKMHVKKDDVVAVLRGDDKGKTGKVLEARPRENRVVIEGVNIQKRHMRPTRTNPQGGVVERPGPIAASNVLVVCPHCKRPVRTRRQRTENGVVRQCARCGKNID